MRAVHCAVTILQTTAVNLLHAESLEADATQDDIRNAVEGADFMEVDVFRRLAMDFSFRHSDAVEDRNGVLLYERGEGALFDQFPDLRVGAAFPVVVMVPVFVLVSMLMPVLMVMVAAAAFMVMILAAVLMRMHFRAVIMVFVLMAVAMRVGMRMLMRVAVPMTVGMLV